MAGKLKQGMQHVSMRMRHAWRKMKDSMKRSEWYGVALHEKTYYAPRILHQIQSNQNKWTVRTAVAAGLMTAFSHVIAAEFLGHPENFSPRVREFVTTGLASAGIAGLGVYASHRAAAREARHQLSLALVDEMKLSPRLYEFLCNWKYLYVDSRGMVAGTNLPRLIPFAGYRFPSKELMRLYQRRNNLKNPS